MEDLILLKVKLKKSNIFVENLRLEIKQLEEMLEIQNQTIKDKQRIIDLLTEKIK